MPSIRTRRRHVKFPAGYVRVCVLTHITVYIDNVRLFVASCPCSVLPINLALASLHYLLG